MNRISGPSPILAAVVLLLVGAIGVLGGVVLDRTMLRHRIDRGWAAHGGLLGPPSRELRRHLRERIEAHMAEELDLSDSQREQVAIVLERQEERLAVVMAEARPQIDEVLEETHRQLLEILTPEQREEVEERWRAGGWRHRLLRPDSAHGRDSGHGI